MLPTKSLLKNLAKNNNLTFKEHLSFGKDYAKTLSIWRNNFLLNWNKIKKLGYDENFKRLWEYYLTYCEVGFINGSIDVSQFLLEKKKNIMTKNIVLKKFEFEKFFTGKVVATGYMCFFYLRREKKVKSNI